MKKGKLYFLLVIAVLVIGCSEEKEELIISAAASLTEAMQEIEPLYEEKYGVELTVNIASSGTLQKQIEEGAPVDVFLSASEAKMDNLEKKELLINSSRKNLLRNKLVLIKSSTSNYSVKSIDDLNQNEIKIAVGEPGSVPVGKYSKQSFEYYKVWNNISDKVVYAKNVKQTLAYVESGEADVGIVYFSDTGVLKNSEVILDIPDETHGEIVYPVSIIRSSKHKESAEKFIEFISSDKQLGIFEKNRFGIYK